MQRNKIQLMNQIYIKNKKYLILIFNIKLPNKN